MTTSFAYFFVIHGSRNPETLIAASKLQQLLTWKIKSKIRTTESDVLGNNLSSANLRNIAVLDSFKTPLVEIAALELGALPLNQSLIKFAHKAYLQGLNRVKVVPLFLAPGVHVKEDIPEEISLAVKEVNNIVTIELSTFLGKYSEITELIVDKFGNLSAQTRILVSHGSRLPGVADYYQSLASRVNAVNAYWSTDPSLDRQVELQVNAGKKRIGILPYFLFPGKITNAIADQVKQLQTRYPKVELILGQPLGSTEALAELIAREI
ncbi:MAG: sirohydrochlorin chelatase [Pleurocapsa sp.]